MGQIVIPEDLRQEIDKVLATAAELKAQDWFKRDPTEEIIVQTDIELLLEAVQQLWKEV